MTTTKAAWLLRGGDVVLPDTGAPGRLVLGSPRLQGNPAEALVEFAGLPGRSHYPADQPLVVEPGAGL